MPVPPSPSGSTAAVPPAVTPTFHRRPLPSPAVAFSSLQGQKMFAEALAEGTVGGYFFRLIEQFHTQNEPAFCGLGTLTMVLNALNIDPKATWKGPWRWFHEEMLSCCESLDVVKEKGIVWPKWLCLARCNGAFVEAHRAEEVGGDLESFRRAVRVATSQVVGSAEEEKEPLKVLVVAYSRKQFGQTGDGHFSPIGGYHAASDSVLVLDVARFKHPPHWVKLSEMHEAMKRTDRETRRSRGFAMLSAQKELGGWLSLEYRSVLDEQARESLVESDQSTTDETPAAASEHLTLDKVAAAFAESVGAELPGALEGNAVALASEAMRRAVRFVEGPLMPLSVQILPALTPEEVSSSQMSEDEKARANEEWHSRLKLLGDLKEAARSMHKALTRSGGSPSATCLPGSACDCAVPDGHLAGCELRAALILSLDLSLWTSALCPEEAPKAEPPSPPRSWLSALPSLGTGSEMLDLYIHNVETPGAQAWRVLRPMLELEHLPPLLRHQVASLRAQCADLLTRDNTLEVADCRGAKCACQP